jgi:3-oxoacyl-[acyl-carrier protein] reductase
LNGLDGRRILVTGAAQGLGRAYALRLAGEGATIAVLDLDGALAGGTVAEIREAGGVAEAFVADVAVADQVQAAVEAVTKQLGGVEVLINNAGGAFYSTRPSEQFSEAEWDHVLDVNLKGQWLCARAVIPQMKERRRGKIVNISSTVVARGYPAGLSPYIAAKAGVIGLTRALAYELGPFEITVNAIAPGYTPVPTPKTVHLGGAAERLRLQMIEEQCLKRSETPGDLADAVVFLASERSNFITGQVLNVDGGWAMG